jgi:hypothetical protein
VFEFCEEESAAVGPGVARFALGGEEMVVNPRGSDIIDEGEEFAEVVVFVEEDTIKTSFSCAEEVFHVLV